MTFSSFLKLDQQQMGGYPQAPENSGFNQSRTAYGSSTESYGGMCMALILSVLFNIRSSWIWRL